MSGRMPDPGGPDGPTDAEASRDVARSSDPASGLPAVDPRAPAEASGNGAEIGIRDAAPAAGLAPTGRAAPAARPPRFAEEAPSPDVDVTHDSSPLPGAHRGGFSRLPTTPIGVTVESAPAEPGTDTDDVGWQPAGSPVPTRHGLAGWALAFAVVALGVSLFVGWGIPLGLAAIVSAIVALRRPLESRATAVWAIAIGAVSVLYSAGWLLFAARQAGLLG